MTNRVHSFRVKLKGKLKVFVVQIRQVGQIMISQIINISSNVRTNIQIHSKKIILKVREGLFASALTFATVFPMPHRPIEINRIPAEAQTQTEHLMPKSSFRFEDMRQDSMSNVESLASQDPERLDSVSNLFGQSQSQKIRGGGLSDRVKSLSLKFVQIFMYNKLRDAALHELLHNPEFAKQLIADPKPTVLSLMYKTFGIPLSDAFSGFHFFQGVEAFTPAIPKHGVAVETPDNWALKAKPKVTIEQINEMVNRPADPSTGALAMQSPLPEHPSLRKILVKAVQADAKDNHIGSLLNQLQTGDTNVGSGPRTINLNGHKMTEFRTGSGTRIFADTKDNIVNVWAIFDKNSQDAVFNIVEKLPKNWFENFRENQK